MPGRPGRITVAAKRHHRLTDTQVPILSHLRECGTAPRWARSGLCVARILLRSRWDSTSLVAAL